MDYRFGMYDENNLLDFDQPISTKNITTIEPEAFDSFKQRDGRRKTYIRRISSIYLADQAIQAINTDDEEDNMELNGDYILKKALLKDHDVQLLRTKEMQHVLSTCCKVHLGKDEKGKKIIQIYKKPEVKEVTEVEINEIVVKFLRTLRTSRTPKLVLDTVDDIQQKIEKICPFGSMVKIMYKHETPHKSSKDVWFMPNREEVETGIVKVENFMQFFEIATQGIKPILIKDIFTTDYQKEVPSFTRVNGTQIKRSDNLSDIWYDAMNMLSGVTSSNLDKLPPELYEWHCFAIPLKAITNNYMSKQHFDLTDDKNDEDLELSISSLESFGEEKEMLVKKAMIMLFLCKKRKRSKQKKYLDLETGKYKFSVQWKNEDIEKKIKTETLIKMLHDIRDIFNSHNEKIYYHMNEFVQFSSLAKQFVEKVEDPTIKRSMSI